MKGGGKNTPCPLLCHHCNKPFVGKEEAGKMAKFYKFIGFSENVIFKRLHKVTMRKLTQDQIIHWNS